MRRYLTILVMWSMAALAAVGCAQGEIPQDETESDADTTEDDDGGTGEDGGDASETGPAYDPPEFHHSTSGGDLSTSEDHRMQMNFGAPIPRGTSENDEHRIQFGPVSP